MCFWGARAIDRQVAARKRRSQTPADSRRSHEGLAIDAGRVYDAAMSRLHIYSALCLALCLGCSGTARDGRGGAAPAPANDGGMPQDMATDDGPMSGGGDSGDPGACTDVVDVVLVLDVSSTMNFVLDTLRDQVASVVEAATALSPDPHFGFIGFTDNHRIDTSGPLEGGMVHTEAATLEAAFANFQEVYTKYDRCPGDGPSGLTRQNPLCEENSLDAIHAAVNEFPWRENAARVIIVATDETFLEAPDNYGDANGNGSFNDFGLAREGDYPAAHTVEATVAALKANRTRVFSFSRRSDHSEWDRSCGTRRRLEWTQVSDGWSTDYNGHPPIPAATDGADFDIDAVRSGQVSMVDTINEVIVDSYCNPPVF